VAVFEHPEVGRLAELQSEIVQVWLGNSDDVELERGGTPQFKQPERERVAAADRIVTDVAALAECSSDAKRHRAVETASLLELGQRGRSVVRERLEDGQPLAERRDVVGWRTRFPHDCLSGAPTVVDSVWSSVSHMN